MRRRICSVCIYVCVTLALIATYDTQAQRNKKDKDPETVISKRGNLIFEDDFSGNELLGWQFGDKQDEWKILKKALVMNEVSKGNEYFVVYRKFPNVKDLILQCKIFLPSSCNARFYPMPSNGVTPNAPEAVVSSLDNSMRFSYYDKDEGTVILASSPLSLTKAAWHDVVLEILGTKYAFTVDGKILMHDVLVPDTPSKNQFKIFLKKGSNDLFAIDDVKVWEALPKDEEPEKDKRK